MSDQLWAFNTETLDWSWVRTETRDWLIVGLLDCTAPRYVREQAWRREKCVVGALDDADLKAAIRIGGELGTARMLRDKARAAADDAFKVKENEVETQLRALLDRGKRDG